MDPFACTNVKSGTSQLGFGCASLMRVPRAADRNRLLELAFDLGIRHFDVARMYGFGRAEAELGRFAKGKRASLVLTTKFGIQVAPGMSRLAPAQHAARLLARRLPRFGKFIRSRTTALFQAKQFSAKDANNSLEISLRELRTDYVDYLLLHEPTPDDEIRPDLIAWLEQARQAGKVRAFGVAGAFASICEVVAREPALGDVVQFPNDVLNRNIERACDWAPRIQIAYGPLSKSVTALQSKLAADKELSTALDDIAGGHWKDEDTLASILLTYSVVHNPNGITLFSTTRPERLRRLVGAVARQQIQPSTLKAVLGLIDRMGEL
jgi:D-threo-aldose 1-dehydrogenase